MGAHTPDAYRYRGGQPAWEYPRPGGNESSSALSARNARRRVPNEDRASQALQSSPFAPREQQAAPEREYAHYDEPSVELARDSSRYGGRRRGEERSYRDREGIAFSAAPARPAPRLVSVDQMYVPAEEVEDARRRHVLAYHYEQADTRSESREAPRKKRRWKLGLGMFVLGFIAGIFATVASVVALAMLVGGQKQEFATAVSACKAAPHATVAADGSSLVMNTFGNKQPGMSVVTLSCVLRELDAPESLMQRMETTRAIDGTREETWGSYRATWTYHPDQGLNVVISDR